MILSQEIINDEKGYTLPYVLIISILIFTLLLSLISAAYFNNIIEVRKLNKKQIELSCYSAVQQMVKSVKYVEEKDSVLNMNGVDVFVETEINGLYYCITSSGKKSNDSAKIKYTFSYKPEEEFENAVIFSRPNLRASVAGSTKINGNILASSSNITRGNIYGVQGSAENFISGEIKVNNDIKSKLYLDTLFEICRLKKNTPPPETEIIDGDFKLEDYNKTGTAKYFVVNGNLSINGNLKAPRKNKTVLTFYVSGKTSFTDVNSDMDIKIYSDSSVFIESNCSIKNLFVYAAKDIEIKNNCKLQNVQFLSERNISISGSLFNYPSVIAAYVDAGKPVNLNNKINIESSVINGTIALVSSTVGLGSKAKIFIDEKSRIQGLVYSENLAEIKGKIDGILYVYNLYYYKEPTEYINWMVNLQVDRKKLDKWFLLPMGFVKGGELEILREERIY